MTDNRKKFGQMVRGAREDRGMGLRELARKIGMDHSKLSRIERGQRPPPDLEQVIEIGNELGVNKTRLLRLAGVPDAVIFNLEEGESVNWISGQITGRSGSLIEVEAGDWTLHIVEEPETRKVLLGLRPEDITLFTTDQSLPNSSARNRVKGKVQGVNPCDNYNLVQLNCGSFSLSVAITDTSLEKMDLAPGTEVYATFKATAPVITEVNEST
ncbi:MAG: helix-turn-helix domain-containing protein [Candidatus Bipolaricaulota bacterium]